MLIRDLDEKMGYPYDLGNLHTAIYRVTGGHPHPASFIILPAEDGEYLRRMLPYVGAPPHDRLMSMHPLSNTRSSSKRCVEVH